MEAMEVTEGVAMERDEEAMEAMENDTVDTEGSIMVDTAEDDTMVVTARDTERDKAPFTVEKSNVVPIYGHNYKLMDEFIQSDSYREAVKLSC